jgi:hypothetical protein
MTMSFAQNKADLLQKKISKKLSVLVIPQLKLESAMLFVKISKYLLMISYQSVLCVHWGEKSSVNTHSVGSVNKAVPL